MTARLKPVRAADYPVLAPHRAPGLVERLLSSRGSDGRTTFLDHIDEHGPLPVVSGDRSARQALIELVDRSGLLGRGGAGFPTALKLAAVAGQAGVPFVVANGTEGEPASAKDKVLLARSPHLVIDGAVLAAQAVGAPETIVVCHPSVRDLVDVAIRERNTYGPEPIRVRAVDAAERFVAGEASAVVHWLERGIPTPTRTPPRLAERGLHGRPTLVQNVETLAHLGLIARYGAEWYRSIGTYAEPGSMLVSLLGAVERPGVYEVEIGAPVAAVLATAGAAIGRPQALLLGGYFGSWSDFESAVQMPFSRAGLTPVGAGPGAGVVALLPDDVCGLVETARVARYLSSESAGQCGPCVFGLPAIASELESLAAGGPFRRGQVDRWLKQVDGRGACRHPDGAVRMIRSALTVFSSELERHSRGRCCATKGASILPVPPPLR